MVGVKFAVSAIKKAAALKKGVSCGIINAKTGKPMCFAEGTLVLCKGEDGIAVHKPIEDIVEGDLVWAYDEETGRSDWKPVVELFRNKATEWISITVNGEDIVSTSGHKYYLPENTFYINF